MQVCVMISVNHESVHHKTFIETYNESKLSKVALSHSSSCTVLVILSYCQDKRATRKECHGYNRVQNHSWVMVGIILFPDCKSFEHFVEGILTTL